MLTSNGLEGLEPGIHREELAEISMVAKALARKLDELKMHPAANTQSANHRLLTLAARLTEITESVEIRERTTSPSTTPQVHPSDSFLSCELPKGWERAFTEDDVPYYIHHDREETHWDHPELITLMTDILVSPYLGTNNSLLTSNNGGFLFILLLGIKYDQIFCVSIGI
jgi:hypothetical protein